MLNPQDPTPSQYWLKNARVPQSLINPGEVPAKASKTREDLVGVDVEIKEGAIAQIIASSLQEKERETRQVFDLQSGQLWPCFVDMHTHLDKGHIWERSPNPDGTFHSAIETVLLDAERSGSAEDLYQRFEFGLKCSYAHGTKAIRTHIDSQRKDVNTRWEVFQTLQEKWQDRMVLQAVALVSLDYFLTPQGEALADKLAEIGGVLGGIPVMDSNLDSQLDRLFSIAKERHLNIDLHIDESINPANLTLPQVARAAIRHQFSDTIICGHCCSLAVQSEQDVAKTLALVKEAGIGIVSLPMCNLYLQDRQPGRTPRWRGVTLLQELKAAGIPVAVASDNCRDPFYSFGDHDVLEVLTMAVRIAHLDMPYGNWPRAVTSTPADWMNLPSIGRIGVGLPADLILFKGRSFSELLSRSQHDRVVLRQGKAIDTTLPDYAELDPLMEI